MVGGHSIACAISITAFPVLARIINETGLLNTTVGYTALGAAAIDDVTAWYVTRLVLAHHQCGSWLALIFPPPPLLCLWDGAWRRVPFLHRCRSLLALSVALIHASKPVVAAWILLSVVAYAVAVLCFLRPIWSNVIHMVRRRLPQPRINHH